MPLASASGEAIIAGSIIWQQSDISLCTPMQVSVCVHACVCACVKESQESHACFVTVHLYSN